MTTTHTVTVRTEQTGRVEVSISDRGQGHPFLLLHGGAGPQSVTAFADQLAAARHARVLVPAHPGFSGTPRPERPAHHPQARRGLHRPARRARPRLM